MNWISFLHIYQPPWQSKDMVDRVVRETYYPLIKIIRGNSRARVTLNICGSLTELLDKYGYNEIIRGFRELAAKKRIEFTGSAAYHAFLPLIPEEEVKRQIMLNNHINKKYFGKYYHPQGFFSPEMGYSNKLVKLIKKQGFKWMLADVSILKDHNPIGNYLIIPEKAKGLAVFISDHKFSDAVNGMSSASQYVDRLKREAKDRKFYITASDGELYGHNNKKGISFLKKAMGSRDINPLLASELYEMNEVDRKVERLRSASWSTRDAHFKRRNPYPLWDCSSNNVHRLLWKLANLAIKEVRKNKKDPNYKWARKHLDWGLASCTWWWAGAELNWSPDEIEKGALQLIKSVRSLNKLSDRKKIEAEDIYSELIKETWRMHWSGEARRIQKKSIIIKK